MATCRQLPYLHKPAIVVVTSFSLSLYGARSLRVSYSHYDVMLIVTSFATELAMPNVTDKCTYITFVTYVWTPYRI